MNDNRNKEEKKVEMLKDPKEQHSSDIKSLIDKALKSNKVYVATDWHLYVRNEKNKPACHKRKNFNEIIKNCTEVMGKDDVLIYLGDLCDGEMKNEQEEMKTILNAIPGHKILVLGNNDLFPTSYYKSCGFEYVVQSFEWHNILFTHMPVENNNTMNIHGHLHSDQYTPTYWIPYKNNIDVAWCGARQEPQDLVKVIASIDKFKKHVKEDRSKFEEGYTLNSHYLNIFEQVSENQYIEDPFPCE